MIRVPRRCSYDEELSLVDHLDELRSRLIVAGGAVLAGTVVGYLVHRRVLEVLVQALPVRFQPLMAFLRGTGARFGEATALYGRDFHLDVEQPTVRIEKAWKRDENDRFYIGPPKTKKSRRTVSLSPSLVAFVRPAVEAAGPTGLVFTTSYGGPIRHSSFYEFWEGALTSLGYGASGDRPRIHDMRHTHASLMLGAGMSPFELSRRLGHESIQTTIDRYSHLVPDAQFRAAVMAEKALEA